MKICINNTSLNHHLGSGTPCSEMLVQHPSVTLVRHATETVVHHKPKYANNNKMNKSKKYLSVLLTACLVLEAQSQTGIQWVKNLSWQQVKEKAKKENKYIMVDAFTTWCAPCKLMDKEVFTVDSVANFYNKNYLPVKVQMDETRNDGSEILAWREDAKLIKKQFNVDAFPTYLFFSPEGILVDKKAGAVASPNFISWGRNALMPGLVYNDYYERFYKLRDAYNNGMKEYDSMYYMVKLALKKDKELAATLIKDLDQYLESLPARQLYTKERVEYMASVTNGCSSKWFNFFYNNSKKINKTMHDNNFAERVIQQIIVNNVVCPYLDMGPQMGGIAMYYTGKVEPDLREADWTGLEKKLSIQFNKKYAKRCVLIGKKYWYKQNKNMNALAKAWFDLFEKYGYNVLDSEKDQTIGFNWVVWHDVYLHVDDQKDILRAAELMKKTVENFHKFFPKMNLRDPLDTYASLLYKANLKDEAIIWEEKSVEAAKTNKDVGAEKMLKFLEERLAQMRRGEKLDGFDYSPEAAKNK